MRLDRYKTFIYRVNDDSQLMPELFAFKLTIIWNDYLSEEIDKFTFSVIIQSSNIDSQSKLLAVNFLQVKNDTNNPLDYGFMYNPICNHPSRICSENNINFPSCIVHCFDIENIRIELIANTVRIEIVFNPMLQIVETAKEFVFGNYQDSQKYKFFKLTLVDGYNHIIHCRLSIHFSNEYNNLKKEMIMRLDRYTPLRFRVNDI